MSINKLKDICEIKVGKDCRIYNDKNNFENVGDVGYLQINDLKNVNAFSIDNVELKINKNWKESIYENVIICSRAGSAGIFKKINCKVHLDNRWNILIPNENKVLKNFLIYLLNMNREKIIEQRGYSVQINISKEQLENFEIKVPKLIEQQSIIDIIEPKEKLFLKYHELIDITDIDNFHKTWNNLIDIIEPFEIKIQNIKKKINSIERLIEFDYKQFKNNDSKIEYFPSFQGFAFKSNDLNNRGKYKIFKITNINNDNTKDFFNILYENVLLNIGDVVTGLSGTIGTAKIIVDSDWLLNQRLLCIRSNIPLIIKKVIEHNSKLLLNNSTGSVQKNITKKDVLSLTFDKKMISEKNIMLSKLYINYLQQINIIELIIRQLLNIYIL